MKLKKVIARIFSLSLALSPINICADENDLVAVSADNEYAYTDYSSAWSDAKNGVELVMLEDWNLTSRLVVDEGQTVTIDMNGHKIDRQLTSAQSDGQVIYMNKNSSLTLSGNTDSRFILRMLNEKLDGSVKTDTTIGGLITGGATSNGGGGIFMNEGCSLTLDHVGVMSNLSRNYSGSGGGIYADGDGCQINLKNGSKISYNYASQKGGGIYIDNEDAYINMDNSTISQNDASYGGAICSDDDATRITMNNNSKIIKNTASQMGGAIYFGDSYGLLQSQDSTGVVSNNTVENSQSNSEGGAVFFAYTASSDHEAEVKNITFEKNVANTLSEDYKGQGGAICSRLKNVKISNCTFKNNQAQQGGAIYEDAKQMHLIDCTIEENEASENGGAVYVDSQYDLYLEGNLSIQNNTRTSDSTKNDIYLEDGTFTTAYVSGTPSNGSSVGLLGDGEIKVGINQSENNGSFFCDADNYHLEWSGSDIKQKSGATGSVFGNGNTLIALCVMFGIGVVGAVVLVVNKKKKSA